MDTLDGVAEKLAEHFEIELHQNPNFNRNGNKRNGDQYKGSNGLYTIVLTSEDKYQSLRFARWLERPAQDGNSSSNGSNGSFESINLSTSDNKHYDLAYKTSAPAKCAEKYIPFANDSRNTLEGRFVSTLGQILPTISLLSTSAEICLPFSLTKTELGEVHDLIIKYFSNVYTVQDTKQLPQTSTVRTPEPAQLSLPL
ncbi:hypothetical protein HY488_00930 [Candidatus Woesearchaeota archaeon]|nr:hypothetical protein [Candidatus Woesearchaeota archaeon]